MPSHVSHDKTPRAYSPFCGYTAEFPYGHILKFDVLHYEPPYLSAVYETLTVADAPDNA